MKFPRWATTVTPLSKVLALIIFITFPIVGFWLGIRYQSMINNVNNANTYVIIPQPTAVPEMPLFKYVSGYSDGNQIYECSKSLNAKLQSVQGPPIPGHPYGSQMTTYIPVSPDEAKQFCHATSVY